jgi:cholest-4-en-3-one 26-monooxygenase
MEQRDIDILDGNFYVNDPYSNYAWMRENAPVFWDATNELWCITRFDDIVEIERRKDVFISSDKTKGGYRPNLPADDAIIGLDDPHHAARRGLVARRFTPKAVASREDHVLEVVDQLITDALTKASANETIEVIADLASPLPALMIGRLLGFPDEQWPNLRDWSERTIALGGGPRFFDPDGIAAYMEFHAATTALYEQKKGCPADDILSHYTTATIEGHEFGPAEALADALLLLDGGAETTRTVIARTLLNLSRHRDQWSALKAGADIAVATEEFIRYVTPIHNMCRVANRDYELSGVTIPAGHQVVLCYAAANRDPSHFTNPETFDVTRTPNQHIAFGFGSHFCLGVALAKLEIRTFFEQFVKRVDSFTIDESSVIEMPNAFVFGLRALNIEITAAV